MGTIYSIYALVGRDGDVRYIGRTRRPLSERARNHMHSGKARKNVFQEWLSDQGNGLTVAELERIEEPGRKSRYSSRAVERETWWIAYYLGLGNELFNIRQRPKVPRCNIVLLND